MVFVRMLILSCFLHTALVVVVVFAIRPPQLAEERLTWVELSQDKVSNEIASPNSEPIPPTLKPAEGTPPVSDSEEEVTAATGAVEEKTSSAVQATAGGVLTDEFSSAMRTQQMTMKSVQYNRLAGSAIRSAVEAAIPMAERTELNGMTAAVTLVFSESGVSTEVANGKETVFRETLMGDINWSAVPSPTGHQLPFSRLVVTFQLNNSKINLSLQFAA